MYQTPEEMKYLTGASMHEFIAEMSELQDKVFSEHVRLTTIRLDAMREVNAIRELHRSRIRGTR